MGINIERIRENNSMEYNLKDGELTEYTYVMLSATVAQTIIKYRKNMGYTQKDLANILNISQARVARLEDGINITLKTLCDINEKIETKEYSFILDVLNELNSCAKKLRKENYYIEVTKVIEHIDWQYNKTKNEALKYTSIGEQYMSYSNGQEIKFA